MLKRVWLEEQGDRLKKPAFSVDRIAELDRKLVEPEDFRERLERIQEGENPESRIYVRRKS